MGFTPISARGIRNFSPFAWPPPQHEWQTKRRSHRQLKEVDSYGFRKGLILCMYEKRRLKRGSNLTSLFVRKGVAQPHEVYEFDIYVT